MQAVKRVAITGGIGAGKTFVTDIFAAYGVPVIDADVISHKMTTPCTEDVARGILSMFGPEYLLPDGSLNRPLFKELIFSNDSAFYNCNLLFLPLVKNELARLEQEAANQPGVKYTVSAIPLLIECGWQDQYDFVITVVAPEEIKRQRVQKRDTVDDEMVRKIESRQANNLQRLEHSDYVIVSGDTVLVLNSVELLHKYLIV